MNPCLARIVPAALVFLCVIWVALSVPDNSGPFTYIGSICKQPGSVVICPHVGRGGQGWWPVDFLKTVGILNADIGLAGPPDDTPEMWVLYDGTSDSTIGSLPAEIDIMGIDYDGDPLTVSVDLVGLEQDARLAAPFPADLASIGPGDPAALAPALLSGIDLVADLYPQTRTQVSLWFVSARDLPDLATVTSITVGPGLEPGRYQFSAEVSDGQTDMRRPYVVTYEPGYEKRTLPAGSVDPGHAYATALLAAGAAVLLALPRLPVKSEILPPGPARGGRYALYCTGIGAAWLAASAALSAQSGFASDLDNAMMLPASLIMMGSPVVYYAASRPLMGGRGGPARTAASVALMASGMWSAFYVLYGIPAALLVIPLVALIPAAGCCLGAALFWAGFRRACAHVPVPQEP